MSPCGLLRIGDTGGTERPLGKVETLRSSTRYSFSQVLGDLIRLSWYLGFLFFVGTFRGSSKGQTVGPGVILVENFCCGFTTHSSTIWMDTR